MKLYILHDNATWLVPICKQLNALSVPYELWELGSGSIDLTQEPPEGVFFNRVSPSSHGRGKRYAMELGAAVVEWLERHGRRVVNGSSALRLENSKCTQEMALQQHGIASPVTTAVTGREPLAAALDGFVARIGGGKFLLKHNRGGSGMGVRLFTETGSARRYITDDAAFEESPDGITLLQGAVDSPDSTMYRMEFLDGQFLYAVKIDTSSVKADAAINNCPADACQLKEKKKQQAASATATATATASASTAASSTPAATPATSSSSPVQIDGVSELRASASAAHAQGKAVVLQFGASWCGACKRAKPTVDALRATHAAQADFLYADADDADELVDELGVGSLPTYMLQLPGADKPTALPLADLGEKLRGLSGGAAPSRKRKAEDEPQQQQAEAKRAKAPAPAHGGGMGNCPLSTPAEKFTLQPIDEFARKNAQLIAKFEALMRENRVDIAGAEIIFDAAGAPFCIDLNSNTNYSVAAEKRFGEEYYGAKRLAAFLRRELQAAESLRRTTTVLQAKSSFKCPTSARCSPQSSPPSSPSLQGSESDDECTDAATMRDAHTAVLRLLASAGGLEGLQRLQKAVAAQTASQPLAAVQ